MKTKLEYLENTHCFEGTAQVVEYGTNESGSFLVLDRTIFYPQGGGQPSDEGEISAEDRSVRVEKVRLDGERVLHWISNGQAFSPGETVRLKVNPILRTRNAALHTAGHLVASCCEKKVEGLIGVKGFHFPEGPYVEFRGNTQPLTDDPNFLADLNSELKMQIQQKSSVVTSSTQESKLETIHGTKEYRTVQIGEFQPVPCGGTHLNSLGEIQGIKATKVKKVKEGARVSYSLQEHC